MEKKVSANQDHHEVKDPVSVPSKVGSTDTDTIRHIVETTIDEIPEIKATLQSFSGPLPPSSEFLQYDRVVPGAAERILAMAEKQQTHRQQLGAVAVSHGQP